MKNKNHIKSAKKTLEIESKGLIKLSKSIGKDFSDLCENLLACKGRIITLGVGKSGHIANKVASTLSSTGSPSYFINAGEALHGDIGAVTKEDIILIFSHSGQSQEIVDILPSFQDKGNKIVSITGDRNSLIAKQSEINLLTDVDQEACPLDLAPTTSTTAALALGDAIAVALLEAKNFSSEDFAKSHPGGRIGKRLLLKVQDLMHAGDSFPKVSPDMSLSDTLLEISAKGLGIAAVIDEKEKLRGVFTDGDLRRCLNRKKETLKIKISSVMSKNCKTIQSSSLAMEAINLMQNHEIYVLIAVDKNNKPIGVIRMHDLMQSGLI